MKLKNFILLSIFCSFSSLASEACKTLEGRSAKICGEIIVSDNNIVIKMPFLGGYRGGPLKPTRELMEATCQSFKATFVDSKKAKIRTGRIITGIANQGVQFTEFSGHLPKRKVLTEVSCQKI
jgi:hypothetical protein